MGRSLSARGPTSKSGMMEVPSHHDYFDKAYVKEWAENAIKERPERRAFFDAFVREACGAQRQEISVLELGPGPGFLAEQLLDRCSISSYYLFDFSPFMFELSRSRLGRFEGKTVFLKGDFKKKNWPRPLPRNFDLVVSLQCVHELRHAERIPRLYAQIYRLLAPGGLFLMCDHVNARRNQRAHFMTVAEHLSALEGVGFTEVREVFQKVDMSLMRGCKG